MKKKKIEKIAKIIAHELNHYRDIPTKISEQIDWSEYDASVSDKFKKMILSLLSNRENIRIETNNNSIVISTEDITSIKKYKKNNSLHSEENYLRIEINKEGFQINKGYRQKSNFIDENIYSEIIEHVRKSQTDYNARVFDELWSDIMKDSGVVRDHNLNELFNG